MELKKELEEVGRQTLITDHMIGSFGETLDRLNSVERRFDESMIRLFGNHLTEGEDIGKSESLSKEPGNFMEHMEFISERMRKVSSSLEVLASRLQKF